MLQLGRSYRYHSCRAQAVAYWGRPYRNDRGTPFLSGVSLSIQSEKWARQLQLWEVDWQVPKPPGSWRNGDISVRLYEMRPVRQTPAHVTDRLAELVCSNSMGSTLPDRALGILKNEMLRMGSFIIRTAFKHALPAGQALAVGRDEFAQESHQQYRLAPTILSCSVRK